MAFGKDEQPTSSSPPPQVISPTVSIATPSDSAPAATSSPKVEKDTAEEITSPMGVVPGVPLSELQNEVAQQQATEQKAINKTVQPSRLVEYIVVAVQLLAIIIIIVGFIPPLLWQNTFLQVAGMLCIGLAFFVGIWAVISFKQKIYIVPTPGPNSFLVTGGPFAYIRHPLYFSLLVGSFGLMLAYPTIPRGLALIILAVILHLKVGYEEKMLAARFNGYEKYRQNTGALFPKIGRKNLVQPASPADNTKTDE